VSTLTIESIEAVPARHDRAVEPKARRAKPDDKTTTLRIHELERDPAVNCRAGGVSDKVAAEYSEAMKAGSKFPAVIVFLDVDGKRWLADGFTRCRAVELAGGSSVLAEVRQGGRREALLYAAGANAAHGARRTNADKRRAVTALLGDPEWLSKGDAWIAARCAVSDRFVAKLRPATPNGSELKREGLDGKLRRVPKRRGKSRAEKLELAATKGIERSLAALTRKHASKRLSALYTQARVWLADLEVKNGRAPAPGEAGGAT
jgi:hypothetical protein